MTFRRHQRLRRQRDFDRVFARRCSVGDEFLVLYADGNGGEFSRLGIKIGRRVGNAVTRNRVKRRIREAFRTGRADLPPALDLVCVVRPGTAASASGNELAASFRLLVRRVADKLSRSASDHS